CFDEYMVVMTAGLVLFGQIYFFKRFRKPFVGVRFFKEVHNAVLKSIVSIFFFRSGEYYLWGIRQFVKKIKTSCVGHFNVEKQKIGGMIIEISQGIRHILKMGH